MTREEAIERMKIIKGDCYIIDDPKDKEAFDMSIFALEQEPYELLIIKSDILLHQEDRKKWIESIKREKENGVIILPPYFTSLLVPNDVEIRIEQPCDDAISREAVDKYIARLLSGYLYDGERERLEIFSAYLRELPSVTQKSGKWIERDKRVYYAYWERYKCSKCGHYGDNDYKFCPNCGAKMVEPQESEDKG